MKLRYEVKANTMLLPEQINSEFGEGFAIGAEFHEGVEEVVRSGLGYTDDDGNLAFQSEAHQRKVFHTIVHINREVLSPDERARIDAIVAAHNPDEKSQLEIRHEEREARRQELLSRRFDPENFPPELREMVETLNGLTELVKEGLQI